MARKPKAPSAAADPMPPMNSPAVGPDPSEKTQIMLVAPASAMEATQIINLDTFEKTQKLAVVSESAMEATQILHIGAIEEPPKAPPPENRLETTLIINPSPQETTQKLFLVPETTTEPALSPASVSPEATVAIPVPSPDPQPGEEDSRSTLAMATQGTAKAGMPELRPIPTAAIPFGRVAEPVESYDSTAEPGPNRRGVWLFGGAVLVSAALGIWYLVDSKVGEAAPSAGSTTSAAIPAPVPPAYQETLRQAQAGDVNAMRTLGAVYAYGLGVPPHRQEGLRWYRKAAAAGNAMAAKEAKDLEGGSN
jgi:hypothetical protein